MSTDALSHILMIMFREPGEGEETTLVLVKHRKNQKYSFNPHADYILVTVFSQIISLYNKVYNHKSSSKTSSVID